MLKATQTYNKKVLMTKPSANPGKKLPPPPKRPNPKSTAGGGSR